jgi:ABC-type polysaccharide/polyol phosphate transport system ATPase subunit
VSASDVILGARGVSKLFHLRHNRNTAIKTRFLALFHPREREQIEDFWALKDVSLTVRRGEALGIIGRNGSGKSTFLKLIAGLQRPTSGHLFVARDVRIGTMIELGIGFHAELTGLENYRLSTSIYGFTRREIDELYPKVAAYAGLENFMDIPMKNYSSGMCMRLGFAIADLLLLDEIFAVGDAEFQKQCNATLKGMLADGKTIIFVSHSPALVRTVCSRVAVLDHGRLVFDGDPDAALDAYQQVLATTGR